MSNSYSNVGMYTQAQNPYYNNYETKKSGPSVLGAATVGALGGGAYGYLGNRNIVGKNGNIPDAFVRDVTEKSMSILSQDKQELVKQAKDFMKHVDKVKSAEELKALIQKNPLMISANPNGDPKVIEEFLKKINSDNFIKVKESVKMSTNGLFKVYDAFSIDAIKRAWSSKGKKFVKTENFKDEKMLSILKNSKKHYQLKKALKDGGISAAIFGVLLGAYQLLTP